MCSSNSGSDVGNYGNGGVSRISVVSGDGASTGGGNDTHASGDGIGDANAVGNQYILKLEHLARDNAPLNSTSTNQQLNNHHHCE